MLPISCISKFTTTSRRFVFDGPDGAQKEPVKAAESMPEKPKTLAEKAKDGLGALLGRAKDYAEKHTGVKAEDLQRKAQEAADSATQRVEALKTARDSMKGQLKDARDKMKEQGIGSIAKDVYQKAVKGKEKAEEKDKDAALIARAKQFSALPDNRLSKDVDDLIASIQLHKNDPDQTAHNNAVTALTSILSQHTDLQGELYTSPDPTAPLPPAVPADIELDDPEYVIPIITTPNAVPVGATDVGSVVTPVRASTKAPEKGPSLSIETRAGRDKIRAAAQKLIDAHPNDSFSRILKNGVAGSLAAETAGRSKGPKGADEGWKASIVGLKNDIARAEAQYKEPSSPQSAPVAKAKGPEKSTPAAPKAAEKGPSLDPNTKPGRDKIRAAAQELAVQLMDSNSRENATNIRILGQGMAGSLGAEGTSRAAEVAKFLQRDIAIIQAKYAANRPQQPAGPTAAQI